VKTRLFMSTSQKHVGSAEISLCSSLGRLCNTQSNTANYFFINPLNAELNPICHLLALLGGATIVEVSRIRVNNIGR
jgi:hypothetical protein